MRPPRFWYKGRGHPFGLLLAPLGWLYGYLGARRLKNGSSTRVTAPVICVGNINAGGVGKTPSVIALAGFLAARGVAAHVVSRGYGGTAIGPLRVNEMTDKAEEVGDEPLLMAAFAPTWVAKDRVAGAKAAIEAGAEVILLDDGFQNPALEKDLSIIVVDAAIGFGNGRVMPAGPLREPVPAGLARGDMIISIGAARAQEKLSHTWPEIGALPRVEARLKPLQMGMNWQNERVIAFAGIGRPEKFFRSLASEGADIVARYGFADHAAFSTTVLQRLLRESRLKGAQLVTTEKDAARLPPGFRKEVLVFPVRLEFAEERTLEQQLTKAGVKFRPAQA